MHLMHTSCGSRCLPQSSAMVPRIHACHMHTDACRARGIMWQPAHTLVQLWGCMHATLLLCCCASSEWRHAVQVFRSWCFGHAMHESSPTAIAPSKCMQLLLKRGPSEEGSCGCGRDRRAVLCTEWIRMHVQSTLSRAIRCRAGGCMCTVATR